MFQTTSNLHTFWIKVKVEYPEIATKALKSLLPFPTSYPREAGFSAVTATKMRLQTRLDVSNTLRVSLSPVSPRWWKTSSGLPLILHYGELYNYLIIYYNVIIIEIKCTIYVMCLNYPKSTLTPGPWKNCLPWNLSLVPKRLGLAALVNEWMKLLWGIYTMEYYSSVKRRFYPLWQHGWTWRALC